MTTPLFDRLIPSLTRGLVVLRAYLDKIEIAAGAVCAEEHAYLIARLAPDMLPFLAQVQLATDTAKGAVARLAGTSAPAFPDHERTVAELRLRIDKTLAFVTSVDPSEIDGAEAMMFDQRFRGAHYAMRGQDYVDAYVLPNFFFHVAVAHAILRSKYVPLGKADYLGHIHGYSLGAADAAHGRVRFLTAEQGASWLTAYGMAEDPMSTLLESGRIGFAADVEAIAASDLVTLLIGNDEDHTSVVMVRLTQWIWDDEYEKDPTKEFRDNAGETRSLSTVPAWVFPHDRVADLHALATLIRERNWSASVYVPGSDLTIQLLEDGRVEVYGRDDGKAAALKNELTGLGAVCESR